jgi:hypothetical protein
MSDLVFVETDLAGQFFDITETVVSNGLDLY